MGEARKDALRVSFDTQIKLPFLGAKITSDAGLLAYRGLDELLGLTVLAASRLIDSPTGMDTQHSTTARLRQSVYSRLAGYDDTNPDMSGPSGCVSIQRCARWWGGEPSTAPPPRSVRWDASRPKCSRSPRIWKR